MNTKGEEKENIDGEGERDEEERIRRKLNDKDIKRANDRRKKNKRKKKEMK